MKITAALFSTMLLLATVPVSGTAAMAEDAPATTGSAPADTASSPTVSSQTAPSPSPRWTPADWVGEDTLQFRTECSDEGEYWSYVWLVVLDGDVWVRLGSRAAGRVDCSATKRTTSIRIAGEQFDDVEMVDTPAMAERVAAAMAEKYSTDIFVRYSTHPYTMRLVPRR